MRRTRCERHPGYMPTASDLRFYGEMVTYPFEM